MRFVSMMRAIPIGKVPGGVGGVLTVACDMLFCRVSSCNINSFDLFRVVKKFLDKSFLSDGAVPASRGSAKAMPTTFLVLVQGRGTFLRYLIADPGVL